MSRGYRRSPRARPTISCCEPGLADDAGPAVPRLLTFNTDTGTTAHALSYQLVFLWEFALAVNRP